MTCSMFATKIRSFFQDEYLKNCKSVSLSASMEKKKKRTTTAIHFFLLEILFYLVRYSLVVETRFT